MKCTPAKFQKRDKVKTPKGLGIITAVGSSLDDDGHLVAVVYRVGRNQYWYEWQLQRSGK